MIGLISGAISTGIGVASAIKNAKKQRKIARQLEENRKDRLQGAEDNYNANALGTTEAEQAALTEGNEMAQEDAQRAQGISDVAGATSEQRLASQERINDFRRKLLSNVNAQRTARKQNAINARESVKRQVYAEQQGAMNNQVAEIGKQQQANMTNIAGGLKDIAGGVYDLYKNKDKEDGES